METDIVKVQTHGGTPISKGDGDAHGQGL